MFELTPEEALFEEYERLENTEWNDKFFRTTLSIKKSEDPDVVESLKEIRRRLLAKSNIKSTTLNGRQLAKFQTDEQSKILASMLPDEVLAHNDYKTRKFEACLFFADISGFTDLSEKYQRIPNGASKLSHVLNFYIGSMVQEILSHGGDVIKYSGDAYIAIFKVTEETSFQDVVNRTFDTAILIQKNCRNYRTEVGILLNVKIAIAVGPCHFSSIGNENSSHYVIVGDALWKVKKLEKFTNPGEILITTNTWEHAQKELYLQEYVPDYRCHKLLDFKDTLKSIQRQHEAFFNFNEMLSQFDIPGAPLEAKSSLTLLEPAVEQISENFSEPKRESEFGLRKSLHINMGESMKTFFRSFMIPPLLKAIDADEPLELLTEMRHCVIVFCNFIIPDTDSLSIIETVNGIYIPLCEIVASHEGIVNKVSLFDKDMMFLVIFGLKGFRHDVESQMGLRCAAEIHAAFKPSETIISVSIGVTTGICYCGVVGHSLRREYSVLSLTVNKAARLMVNYPNIVSCDRETFLRSKMNYKHFTLLPKLKMKGLKDDVLVYQFEEIFVQQQSQIPIMYEHPLLGRDKVVMICQSFIDETLVRYLKEFKQYQSTSDPFVSCFLIKGDTLQGKTRVINEIFARNYRENINCVKITLHSNQFRKPYSTVRSYLYHVLKINNDMSSNEIEDFLKDFLKDWNIDKYLWFLNPIFNVNYPDTGNYADMDILTQKMVRKRIFKILCLKAFENFWIIFIDDLEFTDSESFELFDFLYKLRNVFIVLTVGRRRKQTPDQKKLLNTSFVKQYRLEPIEPVFQKMIACWYMKVSGFSRTLEKFLNSKSNGNPGWIKTCLTTLIEGSKLEIIEVHVDEALCMDLTFGDRNELPESGYIKVAILKEQISEDEYITDLTVESNMMLYDTLTSFEQLICKCASVLGQPFSRQKLTYVLLNNERTIAESMTKLFEMKIFVCASTKQVLGSFREKTSSDSIKCYCKITSIPQACRDLPKYSSCMLTKFMHENFLTTVYDLLTENQRIEYHKRSLMYIYQKTRKCDSCKGGFFESEVFGSFGSEINIESFSDGNNSRKIVPLKKSSVFEQLFLKQEPKVSGNSMESHGLNYIQDWYCILGLTKKNFRNCECDSILYNMYSRVINHCEGANFILKAIEAKIELANVCIKLLKVDKALKLSRDALEQIQNREQDESGFVTYLHGRAYTFLGICHSLNNQNAEAMECFYQTCKLYEINFPTSFNSCLNGKIRFLKMQIWKSVTSKPKNDYVLNMHRLVTQQTTECFNAMFDIFFDMKEYGLAELAACWSLRKALKFDKRQFSHVFSSFSNILKILIATGNYRDLKWLKESAMNLLATSAAKEEIDISALKVILGFYSNIILGKISILNWDGAIDVGNVALKICNQIQQPVFHIKMVPSLITVLINQMRIGETVFILKDFHFEMRKIQDKQGLCWYYALALDVLLDSGYTIISFEQAEIFALNELMDAEDFPNVEIVLPRLFVNMWLWCIRHKYVIESQLWLQHFEKYFTYDTQDTLNNFLTGIRILEGMNLLLVYSIKLNDSEAIEYFVNEIEQHCCTLKKFVKITRIHEERFLLHKIHFEQILKTSSKNIKKLLELKQLATRRKQFFACKLVEHTISVWTEAIPKYLEDYWMNHSVYNNPFEIYSKGQVIYPFSLPLPTVKPKSI